MEIMIAMRTKILNLVTRFRQIFLYGIIGLSALALEIGVFYIMTQNLSTGIAASNAAGMLGGLVFGFTLNARYNFQVNDRKLERFLRYGLVSLGGYILTTSLIFGMTEFLALDAFAAKLLSLPPYFLFQYNVNRLFTFHRAKDYAVIPVTED